jgi:type I restriction enzyme M protein
VHEKADHRAPGEILQSLAKLEAEIQQGVTELERMLR